MILVIGATGRVGGEVLAQLVAKGAPLRVLVQNAAQAATFEAQGVAVAWGDLRRPETLDPAFQGVTKLFLVTPGAPDQVEVQCNAITAAQRAGVQQVVKISDLGASPHSPLVHARWNWEVEQVLVKSGLPYTILRPQFFMQNFLLVLAPSVTAEDAFFAPSGSGRVPFVDIRDIAEVAVAALTEKGHENRIYDLTGPEDLSFADVARILSDTISRDIRCEDVSPEAALDSLVRQGLPGWFAQDLVALFGLVKEGHAAGVSTTVWEVTHHPARPLRQFLKENRAAFQTAHV